MKKILVVGAGNLQVNTIKLIKELGYYCIAIDGNQNSIGFKFCDEYEVIDVLNVSACVEYAKSKKIDGVTTTSATITLPAVSAIAKELGLIGINSEVVDVLRDKYKIKKKLFDYGCNIYGYFGEVSTEKLYHELKNNITYPVVIKPSDGSGSKGISIVYDENNLSKAIKYAYESSRTKNIYVESFIEGKEYGVECFVMNGEVIIYGIIKQTFVEHKDEIEYGHCLPSGLPIDIEHKIEDEVKKAIKCLGINYGSVNMDIILSNDNKPYIIDVGARIGLNKIAEKIVPLATGVDILKNTIKVCLGEKVDLYPRYIRNIATRVILPKPGKVKEIKNYSEIFKQEDVLEIILNIEAGNQIHQYKTKADACGWIFTTGKNIEEAELLANMTTKKVYSNIIYEE
ncbi:MAG: ATP-grasp domain-containing protein [Peptostreptococcaceae bacterium]|nr:ATP-grasp domain-containing protein [Peptostreptococcaceae bacterium]